MSEKGKVGRKREFRDYPLYTRIQKSNDEYLTRLCKSSGMSKTSFLDLHLTWLRENMAPSKAATLVSEARN